MVQNKEFRLGLLTRLYSIQYNEFMFIYPWFMLNFLKAYDINPYPFSKKHFITEIPFEVINEFNYSNNIEFTDKIWMRIGVNAIGNDCTHRFLKFRIRDGANNFRLRPRHSELLKVYQHDLDYILGVSKSIYNKQLVGLYSDELILLSMFTDISGLTTILEPS